MNPKELPALTALGLVVGGAVCAAGFASDGNIWPYMERVALLATLAFTAWSALSASIGAKETRRANEQSRELTFAQMRPRVFFDDTEVSGINVANGLIDGWVGVTATNSGSTEAVNVTVFSRFIRSTEDNGQDELLANFVASHLDMQLRHFTLLPGQSQKFDTPFTERDSTEQGEFLSAGNMFVVLVYRSALEPRKNLFAGEVRRVTFMPLVRKDLTPLQETKAFTAQRVTSSQN